MLAKCKLSPVTNHLRGHDAGLERGSAGDNAVGVDTALMGKGVVTDMALDPNAKCSRSDAALYLWRYAGSPASSPAAFTDVAADSPYAGAVAWAVEKGVTKGTSSTTFSPDSSCTRGQIVTFLYRDLAEK